MSRKQEASFDQQYRALREDAGVVALRDWCSVTITGGDRHAFLHNFCTNDIKQLIPGQSCEAFCTNVKGKIVGHGLIACRHEELVVIGVPRQAASLVEHLDRYVIREDVQLQDTSEVRGYLLLAGAEVAGTKFEAWQGHAGSAIANLHCDPWNLVGSEFALLMEVPLMQRDPIRDSLIEHGFMPSDEGFAAARIEAGVPLFRIDFDEQNLPQEVGRDREAISFTKGCYLGQETVARIDALGHVNQRLTGVRFFEDRVPDRGTELSLQGKTVGHVTSVAFSPRLNAPLALAMVRREANTLGTRFDSDVGEAEVVDLPLDA